MAADTDRVQELLDTASRLAQGDRRRYLHDSCGDDDALRREVESLLAALEHSDDYLERGALDFAAPTSEAPGDLIDRYRLARVIGEGGFGVVWRAEQVRPVRRDVALKVVKPGMDTPHVLARFASEQQALAVLGHPGVARVYDAGVTARGRPYFVMELAEGPPLTAYCDAGRLDVRRRVALVVDVCEAIHHAHQRGILHRDLKPSNVLVAEVDGRAAPKVIDFGVAKALGQPLGERPATVTQEGNWVGTPAYMSPEQFGGGGVDTRSDLYSIGVLLYELLTGTTPLRLGPDDRPGPAEIERRVTGAEAPPPAARLLALPPAEADHAALARSTTPAELRRALRGELTWIVGKCLDLDPARRYPSVAHLAEELRRYLAGMPVEVGPPGVRYRLKKFTRRHRRTLATWALVLTAVAAVGWGWATWRAFGPDSRTAISNLSQRGEDLRLLGKVDEAEPLFRQATAEVDRLYGPNDTAQVIILWNLIQLLNDQGRYEEALEFDRRLLEIARRGKLSPGRAADLSDWYGGKLYLMGRYEQAYGPLVESVAIQEKAGFQRTDKYRMTLERLAWICERVGKPDDAAKWRAKLADRAAPAGPPAPSITSP